jgi:hypothetical protein
MSNCLPHPRERSQKVHKHTEIQSVGLARWQAATNGTNKIGQSDALRLHEDDIHPTEGSTSSHDEQSRQKRIQAGYRNASSEGPWRPLVDDLKPLEQTAVSAHRIRCMIIV